MTSVATSAPSGLPPVEVAKRLLALDGLRGIAILVAYFSYLFHIPIIEISIRLMKVTVTDEGNVKFVVLAYLLGVAVTLSLAGLSWIFFEKPLIRRGREYTY
jgi:peptidoglycan/LPS O-acetylase OafA/YrhL